MNPLFVDIGNTAIKWCEEIDGVVSAVTRCGRSPDALVDSLAGRAANISQVVIASVAGQQFEQQLTAALNRVTTASIAFVRSEAATGPLRNSYAEPERMGADRWLAMLGAFEPGAGPVCVVDAGTAITIDLVNASGGHQGGYILPGIGMMTTSLLSNTDRIRFSESAPTTLLPGQSTAACVTAGVWAAGFGAIAQIVMKYPAHRVMVTGGDGPALMALGLDGEPCPHLVFDGLRKWLSLRLT